MRIRYHGLTAKEVTAGVGLGIKFRQLSDGKRLIQLIYDAEDNISDCEYQHDKQTTHGFITAFHRDITKLQHDYNTTVILLQDNDVPKHIQNWLNYKKLKNQCKKVHKELKKLLKDRGHTEEMLSSSGSANDRGHRGRRDLSNYLIMPGTLWCGRSTAAAKYTALGPMLGTDRCCRRHDYCANNIPGFAHRYGLLNRSPFTLSACHCDLRSRRDLNDYLRIPGTKWCGKGRSASKYTDLGLYSMTDKCCRRHDTACPFWISGFATKYGLFNWRVNTIMHCHCDERFRGCLKRVGTSDANLVGKLFFNVVQTKCFVFKPKKTCVKRTWWGKCQQKKVEKQAVLRDNMPY